MNCPFCAEEIKDAAVVCKHCRRDLSIVLPVWQELRAQSARINALSTQIDGLRAAPAAVQPAAEPPAPERQAEPAPVETQTARGHRAAMVGGSLLAAFLLLIVAHFAIVMVLDLNARWLLAATVLIPTLAAILTPAAGRLPVAVLIVASLALGVAGVAAMSLVTASGDPAAAAPRNRQEWIDDVGWVLSIALSYLTGALLARAIEGGRGHRLLTAAGTLLTEEGAARAEARITRAQKLVEVGAPIVTAIGAVATGIQGVLNGKL